jgi:ureidoacrylate peracid hydrolase
MTKHTYDKEITALLVIDPYNDFISEGGKIWDRIRAVAEANDCVPHMLQVLNAARQAKLRVFSSSSARPGLRLHGSLAGNRQLLSATYCAMP